MKRLPAAFGAIFASEGTFTGRASAFRHIKNFSIVVATSLTLVACGGGGGGGGGGAPPAQTIVQFKNQATTQAPEIINVSKRVTYDESNMQKSGTDRRLDGESITPIVGCCKIIDVAIFSGPDNSQLRNSETQTGDRAVSYNHIAGQLTIFGHVFGENRNGGITEGIYYQDYRDGATNYMEGGYWLWIADDEDFKDISDIELGAFARGEAPLTAIPTAGSATFTGIRSARGFVIDSAIGDPVGNVFIPLYNTGSQPSNLSYAFWDVSLVADFAAKSIRGTLSNQIDAVVGHINPFPVREARPPVPSNINLNSGTFDSSGFFLGTTSASRYSGQWGGRFYGDGASQVTGTFGLENINGNGEGQRIIGTFQASKQ